MDEIKLPAPDDTDYVIYCACGERLQTYFNPNKRRIEVYCQACIDGAADIAKSEVAALNATQPCGTCDGSGEVGINFGSTYLPQTMPCPDCPESGDECKPCYGLSCPHWAMCHSQFKADVQQLDKEALQAAARIVELEAGYAIAKEELHDILESRDKTTKELFDAYTHIEELEKALEKHKHTDECLAYAAKTAKASGNYYCIAKCADSLKAALGDGGKDG